LKGKKLMETAVVRRTYARWCGGTAARAASYPICFGNPNAARICCASVILLI
jgi:hypothetical protein